MTKTRVDYTLFHSSKNPDEKPFLSIATMVWDVKTNETLYWHNETISAEMDGARKVWRMWREFVKAGDYAERHYMDDEDGHGYKAIEVVKRW